MIDFQIDQPVNARVNKHMTVRLRVTQDGSLFLEGKLPDDRTWNYICWVDERGMHLCDGAGLLGFPTTRNPNPIGELEPGFIKIV